ncbi:Alginate biosynthesis protein AlgA [Paenibacillus konkukensis]|uniref:Alginate biosynthesis protein AlgA n=1 Tax=Paenibacillus konkukensis TaxID=2020716 RepID=A0ABY4RRB1_9BACL|nr:sugar phosphate nucleotidyltransferase [Paenibacillus konkukensis]UQZ83887.1 Alginate biosynthesis protein AlgA [Paenibacillus konkukensis]
MILLSGGSGVRLWPLSNEQRSKQFLPLFKDERARPVSMLQRVWKQLERRGMRRSAVIAASAGQCHLLREQLGEEAELVLEPSKRDTFPAIALSVSYLHSVRGVPRDEYVAVMPVDGQVTDSFYDALDKLPAALERTGAQVALMGVRPAFPSEKYGYLIPDRCEGDVFTVRQFYEKPSADRAARYIELGGLWNCGVFCFRVGFLLDKLNELGLPSSYERLLSQYDGLECRSFDYAVLEKERSLAGVMYDGPWKDLGTWSTLTEEMSGPVTGEGFIADGCRNVHIVNELKMPILVLGLSDVVVAASDEGILVAHKEESAQLKHAWHQMMEGKQPKRGESVRVQRQLLDQSAFADGSVVTTSKLRLETGEQMEVEALAEADKGRKTISLTVLQGLLGLTVNGEEAASSPGMQITLEHGDRARLRALAPAELIEIVRMTEI